MVAVGLFFASVLIGVWVITGKKLSTRGCTYLSVYHWAIVTLAFITVDHNLCIPSAVVYIQVFLAMLWAAASVFTSLFLSSQDYSTVDSQEKRFLYPSTLFY